eukprot:1714688-Rhodomonas_salina.2
MQRIVEKGSRATRCSPQAASKRGGEERYAHPVALRYGLPALPKKRALCTEVLHAIIQRLKTADIPHTAKGVASNCILHNGSAQATQEFLGAYGHGSADSRRAEECLWCRIKLVQTGPRNMGRFDAMPPFRCTIRVLRSTKT